MKLVFMMGPTNAGKSTVLKYLKETRNDVGLIEVGKALRAKYGPDYFKGQAAPAHTAVEAWSIMLEGIAGHWISGAEYAVVDGQPRDYKQCYDSMTLPYPSIYINLFAPAEAREARARKRDADDPAALELALSRLHGDLPMLYSIVSVLQSSCQDLHSFDTTKENYLVAINNLLTARR